MFLPPPTRRLAVGHRPPSSPAEDLAQVVVPTADGRPVPLTDVARLVVDQQPLFGDAVINDGPGIMLIVEKFPWANTLDVTRGVEAAISDLRPVLPGIAIDTTIFRPASFIDVALENLTRALLLGSILVLLVLYGTLPSLSALDRYVPAAVQGDLLTVYQVVLAIVGLYLAYRLFKDVAVALGRNIAKRTSTNVDDVLVPIV